MSSFFPPNCTCCRFSECNIVGDPLRILGLDRISTFCATSQLGIQKSMQFTWPCRVAIHSFAAWQLGRVRVDSRGKRWLEGLPQRRLLFITCCMAHMLGSQEQVDGMRGGYCVHVNRGDDCEYPTGETPP